MSVPVTRDYLVASRKAAQQAIARARTEQAQATKWGEPPDRWRGVAEKLARLVMSLTEDALQ